MWTTFTSHQIDLNLTHPAGRSYLDRVLTALAEGGVPMVRPDAVGYAIKTAGTSSFMTPRTLTFIDELTAQARTLGQRTGTDRRLRAGPRGSRVRAVVVEPVRHRSSRPRCTDS